MAVKTLTGKGSTIKVDAVVLNIKSISPKHNFPLSDSTGSDNYDATSDLVHKSQMKSSTQTEFSVEGWFDKTAVTGTMASVIAKLYDGTWIDPVPVDVTLAKDGGTAVPYGYGDCDIEDFETTIEQESTVGFKCSLKTNGVFTFGTARPVG